MWAVSILHSQYQLFLPHTALVTACAGAGITVKSITVGNTGGARRASAAATSLVLFGLGVTASFML
jgi:hypothetical protein